MYACIVDLFIKLYPLQIMENISYPNTFTFSCFFLQDLTAPLTFTYLQSCDSQIKHPRIQLQASQQFQAEKLYDFFNKLTKAEDLTIAAE